MIKDSGDVIPMDIPLDYICEMLCDWHSFSYKDPSSTALDWYTKNKDNMNFSETTRKIVEDLVKVMDNPITEV